MGKDLSIPVSIKRISAVCRALIVIAVGALLSLSLVREGWIWARIPVMTPRFADLRMLTSTADCVRKGSWTILSQTCDIYGREYNYPTIWVRAFAFLGLGETSTEAVGIISGILLIALFVFLAGFIAFRKCSWFHLCFVCASAVSPPVLLLLERGNTEIYIIILITGAALSFRRKPMLSAVLSSIAVGLKIFPALIVACFFENRNRWRNLFIFTSITLIFLAPVVGILGVIAERTPQTRYFSFGASSSLGIFVPSVLTVKGLYLLPLNFAITVGISALLYKARTAWFTEAAKQLVAGSIESSLFNFAGLSFIGTYMSGTRFDYSLSFLVVVITAISLTNHRNRLLTGLQSLILISLWLAFGSGGNSATADIATSLVAITYLSIYFARFIHLSEVKVNKLIGSLKLDVTNQIVQ